MECLTERLEWGEWVLTQAFDVAEQLPCKRPARSGVAVFEQQELTEALPHSYKMPAAGCCSNTVRGAGDQAAVLQACRIEQPPESEELLLDQANHVEAIGGDQSIGENFRACL